MISVIVPCKNRLDDLKRCLCSIYRSVGQFHNSYSDEVEIIVADDHSDDGFRESVKQSFPDVLICASNGKGPGHARNDALEFSKGQYLYYTDSDCEVHEDWIAAGYKALQAGGMIVQGNPCLFQKNNYYGIQEENLYTLMFSRYVNDDVATMTDSRNLLMKRDVTNILGCRIFAEKQDKATAESRVFAKKCLDNNIHINYAPEVKVFHKDPNSILESCQQKYRHGTGRIMIWDKKQDFDFLETRYFKNPIRNAVDAKYVVSTHGCFLHGFFIQFRESDRLYYDSFMAWLEAISQKYISKEFFDSDLKEVLKNVR